MGSLEVSGLWGGLGTVPAPWGVGWIQSVQRTGRDTGRSPGTVRVWLSDSTKMKAVEAEVGARQSCELCA